MKDCESNHGAGETSERTCHSPMTLLNGNRLYGCLGITK